MRELFWQPVSLKSAQHLGAARGDNGGGGDGDDEVKHDGSPEHQGYSHNHECGSAMMPPSLYVALCALVRLAT